MKWLTQALELKIFNLLSINRNNLLLTNIFKLRFLDMGFILILSLRLKLTFWIIIFGHIIIQIMLCLAIGMMHFLVMNHRKMN